MWTVAESNSLLQVTMFSSSLDSTNLKPGLIVKEKNYLEVYPYDKWNSRTLPQFRQGDEFDPSACILKDGTTSAPKFLTEADLVALMDKNGIGGLFYAYSLWLKLTYVQGRMPQSRSTLKPSSTESMSLSNKKGLSSTLSQRPWASGS